MAADCFCQTLDYLSQLLSSQVRLEDQLYLVQMVSYGLADLLGSSCLLAGENSTSEILQLMERARATSMKVISIERGSTSGASEPLVKDHDYQSVTKGFSTLGLKDGIPTFQSGDPRSPNHNHKKTISIHFTSYTPDAATSVDAGTMMSLATDCTFVFFCLSYAGSAAFLVTSNSIEHILLPSLLKQEVEQVLEEFNHVCSIKEASSKGYSERNAGLRHICNWLWRVAVLPIVQHFGLKPLDTDQEDAPRICWVLSGYMGSLPLHVVGIYTGDSTQNALKYFVSSYASNMEAVKSCRIRTESIRRAELNRTAIIAAPNIPEWPELRSYEEEKTGVLDSLPKATVFLNQGYDSVLAALCDNPLVHVICHGKHNRKNPLESQLILGKGNDARLRLKSLMEDLEFPQAFLALLLGLLIRRNF